LAYTPQDKLTEHDKARRLAAQRLVGSYIPRFVTRIEKGGEEKRIDLIEKVFIDLAKRFKGRPGGYTRIVKFGPRRGDNAPVSMIELVGEMAGADGGEGSSKKKAKTGSKTKKATAASPAAGAKAE